MNGRIVASVGILAWAAYLWHDMSDLKQTEEFKKRFPDIE
jgi:hypothetical protein